LSPRFLVDASTDAGVAFHLRSLGFDVTRVGWEYPAHLPDREILRIASDERRVLVTDDRDFGELAFRHRLPHAGVIYLRIESTDLALQVGRIDAVLQDHVDDLHRFLVVTEADVRVR